MLRQPTEQRLRGTLIVVAGVLLVSFDALLVRLAGVDGWDVAFWRGLAMALVTAPLAVRALLRDRQHLPRTGLLLAALLMTGSNLGLILAFLQTRAANVVVILAAAPLFAALLSHRFLQERCPRRTWLAIGLCLAGVVWVVRGSLGGGHLAGDLLALGATLCVGAYFTVFRRFPQLPLTPVIGCGGLLLALVAWPQATPLQLPAASYGWLAVAGLVQLPVAQALLTTGTRYLPAAEVSLFLLLETVLAPIWVWLVFGELPPAATVTGGALILGTLALHTLVGLRRAAD